MQARSTFLAVLVGLALLVDHKAYAHLLMPTIPSYFIIIQFIDMYKLMPQQGYMRINASIACITVSAERFCKFGSCSTWTWGPIGCQMTGSLGPKRASVGIPSIAAR